MGERLLVIGGDAAGMAGAAQVRRRAAGLEIVALEKGTRTSYSACGIPYLVSGAVHDIEDLVARTPEHIGPVSETGWCRSSGDWWSRLIGEIFRREK